MKTPTKMNITLSALAQIVKWVPLILLFLPIQILCLIVKSIGDAADSTSDFFKDAAHEWHKLFKPTFHDRFIELESQVKREKERGDIMASSYTILHEKLYAANTKIADLEQEVEKLRAAATPQ